MTNVPEDQVAIKGDDPRSHKIPDFLHRTRTVVIGSCGSSAAAAAGLALAGNFQTQIQIQIQIQIKTQFLVETERAVLSAQTLETFWVIKTFRRGGAIVCRGRRSASRGRTFWDVRTFQA